MKFNLTEFKPSRPKILVKELDKIKIACFKSVSLFYSKLVLFKTRIHALYKLES